MRGDEGTLFLVAFEELKAATGNDPAQLEGRWESEERLQQLCDTLSEMHRSFLIAEEWTALAFTPHVPDKAAQARRDFDQRWERIVSTVANRDLIRLLSDMLADQGADETDASDSFEPYAHDDIAKAIREWKAESQEEAASIQHAFANLADKYAADEFGDSDWANEAVRAWDRLKSTCGLDVATALWRRRAIPHVLVPSHVSNRYGRHRASLYRRLRDAARAFIFGAPLASLAMQRAILEEVLRDLWGAPKGQIREANLPELHLDTRASRLKRLANDVLHDDPERMNPVQIERAVIENFLLLRELIETAPARGADR